MDLHIYVINKKATFVKRDGEIVCGNSDYRIVFTFDEAWDSYATKTARFIRNGTYTDVQFTGNICSVPKIVNADQCEVGVYAGDLGTTTRAIIPCVRSILCGNSGEHDLRKGTTPTLTFQLPIEIEELANAKVTLCQGNVLLEKKLCDCETTSDTITVKLSQEETFLFKGDAKVQAQLRVVTVDGEALASDVFELSVSQCLDDEVIE